MEVLDTVLPSCRGQVLLPGENAAIFSTVTLAAPGVGGQLPGGGGGHVVTPAGIAPASSHPS